MGLIFSLFNRILGLVFVLLLSPLFLVIALLILIDDGSPVFFKQRRIGKDYTFFTMLKFRTMKKNTPNVATHLLENPEKYVLKVGKILRKLSLDELPNLINIIAGHMSFVGPRPALYNQDDLMELRQKEGLVGLSPGLTGWAQINGRDEISLNEKVALEKEYMAKKSIFFDVKIFLMTFLSVFSSKNIKH